jgi:hypothetical protein
MLFAARRADEGVNARPNLTPTEFRPGKAPAKMSKPMLVNDTSWLRSGDDDLYYNRLCKADFDALCNKFADYSSRCRCQESWDYYFLAGSITITRPTLLFSSLSRLPLLRPLFETRHRPKQFAPQIAGDGWPLAGRPANTSVLILIED